MTPIKSLHLGDSYKYKVPNINLDLRVSYLAPQANQINKIQGWSFLAQLFQTG